MLYCCFVDELVETFLLSHGILTIVLMTDSTVFCCYAEPMGEKRAHGLSASELKIIQRICLELLCQYEQSLSFRDPEPKTNASYYEIIRK